MYFRQLYYVALISTLALLAVRPSAAQDKQKNYDITQLQNIFQQSGQNFSSPAFWGQIFNGLKGILSSVGNTTVGNATTNATKDTSPLGRLTDFTSTLKDAFASPAVQQVLNTGETMADAFLQDYLRVYGISDACYKDLKEMASGVASWTDWAQRMLDSFGKPNTNLKDYQLKWLGSYEECVATEAKDYYMTAEGLQSTPPKFSGRYCAVIIGLEQGQLPVKPSITIGTCMPDSCVSKDIAGVLRAAVVLVTQNETAQGPDVECQEEKTLDAPAIVAICILAVLGLFMVFGTLYDVLAVQMHRSSHETKEAPREKTVVNSSAFVNGTYMPDSDISKVDLGKDATEGNDITVVAAGAEVSVEAVKLNVAGPTKPYSPERPKSMVEKILLSFSVYSNGVKLLSTHQSAGSLGAVNGIRFLSMAWIILGHSYFFAMGFDENIFKFFYEELNKWTFMGIIYASVSVDTFFALSGLLVAYLTLKELKKAGGIRRFNWGMFYFHRFWRLTPAHMLVIMVFTTLMKYWGSGPMWPTDVVPYDNCKKSWWTNLLYVNNFVNLKESCMGWTWYLANDMQFYILSPLILIPLFYQIVIGGLVSLAFLSATVVTTAIIVMKHHYPVQQGLHAPKADDDDYSKLVYVPCYARMGPYIIGLFTGYLLYRMKCICRIPKPLVLLGWLICIGICTSIIYGPYSDKDSHIMSHAESIVYHALHRTGWGIAVCWVVFACATGHGGWINEVLSWKAFVPLGRLTYCAYLLHPIVELNYYMSRRRLVYFNDYEVIYMFLANLVMSYGVAFIASLAFESPMMGLEKALLKRDRRS